MAGDTWRHDSGEYARAHHERAQAARIVAGNARNVEDLQLLLSVLGLDAHEPPDLTCAPTPRRSIEDGFA